MRTARARRPERRSGRRGSAARRPRSRTQTPALPTPDVSRSSGARPREASSRCYARPLRRALSPTGCAPRLGRMTMCPACGRELAEDFSFCPFCAAPLRTESEAPREQRKTVTVLFCDVTGSTSLGEQLDPEALRSLLARYFERMKAIVEGHGGSVEKFIGDAVMAVFGIPLVHEDDALRAVRAAAEMRDAFADLDISGRIGIMT